MKRKIISIILIFIIVVAIASSVFAYTTTGRLDKYTLYIPEGYKLIGSYAGMGDYIDMGTYDSEDGQTYFRINFYDKEFFNLNIGNPIFSMLEFPKGDMFGFTKGDLENDAKKLVESSSEFKITNKELLEVNGYTARRVTERADDGYTVDIYQIETNNNFVEFYFFAENETARQNFINSGTQKDILDSFEIKNESASECFNIPFNDVYSTNWFTGAVRYVHKNGIIKGLNNTTFAPNNKITRGMIVTILHRMVGSPEVSGITKFSDVQDSSKYYYKAVKWATDNKIVKGYNNGKFGPTDNIIRQDLAVILKNFAEYQHKNTSKSDDLSGFSDKSKVSNYALPAMKWAVGAGVITGNAKTKTIDPKGNATRAEVAAMLQKYCTKVGR